MVIRVRTHIRTGQSAAGIPPATVVTFNPSDKSADLTLSNGNLTATSLVNSFASVRATLGRTDVSGKFFFQLQPTGTGGAETIAFANSSFAVTGGNPGAGTDSVSWWPDNHIQNDSAFNGNEVGGATFASGDTIGARWNPALNTVEFFKLVTGAWVLEFTAPINVANRFTPGGAVYPLANLNGFGGFTVISTANFGATAFAATMPAGSTSWDGSQTS